MRKFAAAMVSCLILLVTTAASAGMGYTSDMAVSMINKLYSSSKSDTVAYKFSFDEKYNTYLGVVRTDGILSIASACKSGTLNTADWDKVVDSTQGIEKNVTDVLGTLVDADDYSVAIFIKDVASDTTVLITWNGKVIYDYVNDINVVDQYVK